jgi:isopenicillin-N epimerase
MRPVPPGPLTHLWALAPTLVHLNHGSFGACPVAVLAAQTRLREQLEAEPTGFFLEVCPPLWQRALDTLARFLNASVEGLAFLPNATACVNTVLRSLPLQAGDEVLVLDQAYQACRNAVDAVCARAGAQVKVVALPFPPAGPDDIVERVLALAGPRTRLAMLDTVTSPTALRLPFERLTAELQARGVDVLLDAAHGPGIVLLDLAALNAASRRGVLLRFPAASSSSAFCFRACSIAGRVIARRACSLAPRFSKSACLFSFFFNWGVTEGVGKMKCPSDARRLPASPAYVQRRGII